MQTDIPATPSNSLPPPPPPPLLPSAVVKSGKGLGIASFVLGILGFLPLVIVIAGCRNFYGRTTGFGVLMLLFGLLIHGGAETMGIIGAVRKSGFGWAGVILNGILLLLIFFAIAAALA
jgi:hypothetical protein